VLAKLELPKSTYYYHASRPPTDRWEDVRPLIREAFSRTPNGMGYRQVALVLRNEHGLPMSGKTVLKLMREEGLFTRIRKKRYDSYRGEAGKTADNILCRDFAASRPVEKLATDVTEFKVDKGRVYLSPVLDLFNNEVLSWSVSRSPGMRMVKEMMAGLEGRLSGDEVLLHSDQGWQYQQRSYQLTLERLGITQSMSRKATCLDNAPIESFFGHLKDELYRGQRFESFEELAEEIGSYIEYWNTRRYQVGLKGLSPVGYRAQSEGASHELFMTV
jgi:putative transposase